MALKVLLHSTALFIICACLNQDASAFSPLANSNRIAQTMTPSLSSTAVFGVKEEYDGKDDSAQSQTQLSRRRIITGANSAVGALFIGLLTETSQSSVASAFENKISGKYDDRPKRRGPQPRDIGVKTRKDMVGEEYQGLKNCGPAPNCFCSTDDIEDDPEHNIPAWKWPSEKFGDDKGKAFDELLEVVKAYRPGQANVDGGGFQVVTFDPAKGYLYVQFESLKNGYIDDMEVAWIDGFGERSVQVRSSSRVGYLDFGVNAKRLNYIAKALREKGWDALGVEYASHQDYVAQNSVA